jgi:hypothetical protein
MIETSIQEIRHKAASWQAAGEQWHFHMLVPGCAFNERSDQHAFVLESPSLQKAYVHYSDEPQVKTDHALLLLLYGDEILDGEMAAIVAGSPQIRPILDRAGELSARGVKWHHHIFFPGCIYNNYADQWVIAFEDPEQDQVIEVRYKANPIGDLRKLELLFFDQQAMRESSKRPEAPPEPGQMEAGREE